MKWCKAVSGCTNAVEISSDGVRWETETHSSLYRWAYFGGFDDLPTAFHILTQGRGMVFILPKRVMTPEQIDAARGYFQGRIVAPAPAGPGGGASGAGG